MDKLWAPWRVKYVTEDLKKSKGCVFCKILNEKKDKDNYILWRGEKVFAVLNLYPYNNGHVLVLPNRHVSDLSKMKKQEKDELWSLVERMKKLLDHVLTPDGYNIGINLGKAAGAGFPGHIHVHMVPRWTGDVNFMPALSETKVISQSLKALYKAITDADKKSI